MGRSAADSTATYDACQRRAWLEGEEAESGAEYRHAISRLYRRPLRRAVPFLRERSGRVLDGAHGPVRPLTGC